MNTYGVVGWPIKHSLSPAMHNAAFKELGIDAKYELFEVRPEELENFILNRKDIVGFNITVPYKIRAREIISHNFSDGNENAELIAKDLYYVKLTGAINTVKRNGDSLEYRNTDAPGFLKALREDLKFDTKNKSVLLVGCGGAGRAIIAALSWKNMNTEKIYVYELNEGQVNAARNHFLTLSKKWQDGLREKIEFISIEQLKEKIKECQLLVNASPIGMKEGDSPIIDKKLLHKELSVYDVIYNRKTELIKDAKSFGLCCSGGLGMLLYQGAHAFEFWTEKKAPVEVMRKALTAAIKP